MRNCGPGFLMKLASRPVKPPKFPAARAVQGAAPPPPGGGAAPPHPKSATLTATIMHAWFGPPVDVPGYERAAALTNSPVVKAEKAELAAWCRSLAEAVV